MGSQSLKYKRGQFFRIPPEDLVLITDPENPLFDESVLEPFREATVKSMMKHGVKKILDVRKNGPDVEVVDGRKRTIDAREANRRLVEEGRDPITVRCVVNYGVERDHQDTMILSNELRHDRSPVAKARQIAHYLNMGRSFKDAELVWGREERTLKRWLSLLDLAKPVQAAVTSGQLGIGAALEEFGNVRREDQPAKLKAMDLAPAGTPKKRKPRGSGGKAKKSRPSAKEILAVADKLNGGAAEALRWAAGSLEAKDVTVSTLRKALAPSAE